MNLKRKLDFAVISAALKQVSLPAIDQVVGIATGGIVPASLLAHQLGRPLHLLQINYRDADNAPRHPAPVLLSGLSLPLNGTILLVDDVSVSGQTLALARELLKGHDIITLVLKGRADYVLFPDISECVHWPWQVE